MILFFFAHCDWIFTWLFFCRSLETSKKRDFQFFIKLVGKMICHLCYQSFLLITKNQVIKRQSSIKFLGILLDENLSWKEHLKLTENKVPKNIGLIYKARSYLNKDSLLALYFSYIHSYINYANLVWGSTNRTYLRKINSQQKHTLRLILNKNIFYHSKELLSLVKYSVYIN